MGNIPGLPAYPANFFLRVIAVVLALRMKELAEENAALRNQLVPAQLDETKL